MKATTPTKRFRPRAAFLAALALAAALCAALMAGCAATNEDDPVLASTGPEVAAEDYGEAWAVLYQPADSDLYTLVFQADSRADKQYGTLADSPVKVQPNEKGTMPKATDMLDMILGPVEQENAGPRDDEAGDPDDAEGEDVADSAGDDSADDPVEKATHGPEVGRVVFQDTTLRPKSLKECFLGLGNCTDFDLSGLDTSAATSMAGLFQDCASFEGIDLSVLDTSHVRFMGRMFQGCSALKSVDLSVLDTSSLEDMGCMFYLCESLESVNLTGLDTSRVTTIRSMFNTCTSLRSIDLTGLDTSSVTTMRYVFRNCSALPAIDLTGLDTSNVTDLYGMFTGCASVPSLDLSGFDTSKVTTMTSLFYGCKTLRDVNLSGLDTSNVTSTASMFYGCESLRQVDLTSLDTSSVTVMASMFSGCIALESIDLSGFDTSQAENMQSLFYQCHALTDINLSGLDTSSCKNLRSMFNECKSLKSVDISSFDTSNAETIHYMFRYCYALETVNMAGLDLSKVQDVTGLFLQCRAIKTIDMTGTVFGTEFVEEGTERIFVDTKDALSFLSLSPSAARLFGALLPDKTWVDLDGDSYRSAQIAELGAQGSAFILRASDAGDKMPLLSSWIQPVGDIAYNGQPQTPAVTVVVNGRELPADQYTVEYADNEEPGTASIIVTATGDFAGTAVRTFRIAVPLEDAWVGAIGATVYNGSAQRPAVAVTANGETLQRGRDYTVAYESNTEVGTAKATVIGRGRYMGAVTRQFAIEAPPKAPEARSDAPSGNADAPAPGTGPAAAAGTGPAAAAGSSSATAGSGTAATSLAKPPATKISKLKAAKKAFTVKWAKKNKKQVDGYQIRYSLKKNMKSAKTVTVKGASKASLTVKKLKAGKKYYVQVRTYKKVSGKTVYSAWSAKKTVKVKK